MSDADKKPDELEGTEQPFVTPPDRAARPADPRADRGRRLLRAAVGLAGPERPLRPARRAADRAPAARRHADRDQRDLAVPGAAEDHVDVGVPAGAAGRAVPGLGLRRAGPVHAREAAGAAAGRLEHRAVLRRRRVLLFLRLRQGLHLHPDLRAEDRRGDAGHRGLPELRADDVHRLRRRPSRCRWSWSCWRAWAWSASTS